MSDIENLRVEYRANPLAVASDRPRFSWELSGTAGDPQPSSFRLRVESEGSPVWDSGSQVGGAAGLVEYEGSPLPAGSVVDWTVEVTDTDGATAHAASRFETAPAPSAWDDADWITLRRTQYQHDDFRPAPHLRTRIPGRDGVTRARLHVTAGGVFEPWANGRRLDRSSLLPGWTDYARRVAFHSYDITDEFLDARDVIVGAILADGWYAGGVGPFHKRSFWGKHPVLKALIVIDHADGTRETLTTDETWEAAFGAIQSADLLQGEVIDARKALVDWSRESGGWDHASVEAGPAGAVVPAWMHGASAVAEFAPIAQTEPEPGTIVVDFGQNLAGHVRLRVTGRPGTIIRIRHAEVLGDDGGIYTENLRGARATDSFILSGDTDEFEPSFTYHGYRYAEITGMPRDATWQITSIAISSLQALTGELDTGNELVNKIQQNTLWSMRSNFIEVPTDCPSRDERTGWTGDAQIFAKTAMLNADLGAFYSKWLDDIDDTRMENGALPDIAPAVVMDWAREGSSGYAEAGIIVPWAVYEEYGDRRVLEQFFEPATRWVDYVLERSPDLVWRENRNTDYGDWLAPVETRKDLTATAYFARSAQLVSWYAEVLGRDDEATTYRDLHARIAQAFREAFVDDDGTVPEGTQTALVLALRFDLLLPHQRQSAFDQLAADITERRHLTTGFLAVAQLLPLLSEFGRSDLAYALLLREEYPSWGYSIQHGATTLWERWDGWRPETGFRDPLMNSFNHFAVGCVGEWLYGELAGVRSTAPGWAGVRVAPQLNKTIGRARARIHTIRGWVTADWRLDGDDVFLNVQMPPGVPCEIVLAAVDVVELPVGVGASDAPAASIETDQETSTIRFASGARSFRARVVGTWSPNGTLVSAAVAVPV